MLLLLQDSRIRRVGANSVAGMTPLYTHCVQRQHFFLGFFVLFLGVGSWRSAGDL